MTSPRIFPCSSTIDFSFRIVPLSSPRTSRRLFQVSEDSVSSLEIRTRRPSRVATEVGTGLIGFEPRPKVSGNGWTMDGHQVVETPRFALRPLLGVSLFQKR